MNIKKIVYENLKKITKFKFNDSSNIYNIGIDSLDLIELISDAEDELDIIVPDDVLSEIKTVKNVIDALTNAKKETQ